MLTVTQALSAAGAALLWASLPSSAIALERPLIIAHRGGAALLPENTFPAFDNAISLGIDMIEFDMQVTADDQLIVTHDGTVNASFCAADPAYVGSLGSVRGTSLKVLLKFDCGAKHRDIYPSQKAVLGAHMPALDTLLARYALKKVLFFGETKMPGIGEGEVDPVAFAQLVAAAIRKYGLERRFVLQSSDYRTIDAMHRIDPHVRTCLLTPWQAKSDYLKLARRHHSSCMLLRLQDADAEQVARLRRAGILVFSDVVDDEQGWRDYLTRGVDALFTNDPASLKRFLLRRTQTQLTH
ncbi:glycerophosphodiester phosphodiesterase family protein [Sphingomonas albertensis]|uniref:GP-PDE domain-containing protein n=1 Tax=Sphingomonas albertensis TaxID=2762591 RepID=A0ABR7ALU6_9SPHN|nr:glycerophosphodiester phosphodiesterase family protein [Sphingomonas albertensis]MBC3941426.1 hypothetical protein [Sphingomonas albertensis]